MTTNAAYIAALKLVPQSIAVSAGTNAFASGWHLQASANGKVGINATSVWSDYTGSGVSVGVFDDGIYKAGQGETSTYGKHGTRLPASSPATWRRVWLALRPV